MREDMDQLNKNNGKETAAKETTDKEILIFQAITDLINEGSDLTKMKVGDITARAGIGKGTAYEYFSSKEEMIEKALKYSMVSNIMNVMELIEKEESFRDKFFCLLNYMEDHKDKVRMVMWMFRIKGQMMDLSAENICDVSEEEAQDAIQYITMLGTWFLSFADKENLFTEQNTNFRISALLSQVVQFGMYLHFGNPDEIESVKEFVYEGLIKQLN